MKVRLIFVLLFFSLSLLRGQEKRHEGIYQWEDESLSAFDRILGYTNYVWDELMFSNPDSAYIILKEVEAFAIANNEIQGLGYTYNQMGVSHGIRGNLSEASASFRLAGEKVLEVQDNEMYIFTLSNLVHSYQQGGLLSKALQTLKRKESFADSTGIPFNKDYHNELFGAIYLSQGNIKAAKKCFYKAIELYKDSIGIGTNYKYLGDAYQQENHLDSALFCYQKSLDIYDSLSKSNACQTALSIGKLYFKTGNIEAAKVYMNQALAMAETLSLKDESTGAYMLQGQIRRSESQIRQAINSYQKALLIAKEGNHLVNQQECTYQLYELYKDLGNTSKALTFFEKSKILGDSIKRDEVEKQLQLLNYQNQIRQDSIQMENVLETNQLKYEATLRSRNYVVFMLLSLLIGLILFAYFQNKAKRVKEDLLEQVQEQNEQVKAMNEEIIKTKDQLVVQEKLASLGQLTASIAHEIKNPLNFITNFSEGSSELLEELDTMLQAAKTQLPPNQQQLIQMSIDDLKLNNNDVLKSGLRIDKIVNNMMNHTREAQTAQKMEDVNGLLDLNMNFAYNGFKSTYNSFSAQIIKDYDKDLPLIKIYPQEFGRVILNLVNNACYATHLKSQTYPDYTPKISISSRVENDQLKVIVGDNGVGISTTDREHIFNPFFTTKPTGKGNTGLGLSICYDIVTNLHRGKLLVESEQGVSTEFTILIPINIL